MKSLKIKAIILCAGNGTRTGLPYNKILHHFGSLTCIEHCINAFEAAGVKDITLVISSEDEAEIRNLTSYPICYGGKTRTESVRNALKNIGLCDIVVIHDGARPFVTKEIILDAIKSAAEFGSGIAAVQSTDTVKIAENGIINNHLKRSDTFIIQTPQAFDFIAISAAYNSVQGEFTDDSEIYSLLNKEAHLSKGDYLNKKITRAEDLLFLPPDAKVGLGFDMHVADRGCGIVLGGVLIPCDLRLVGHSDADVLIHAIIDGLLSAAGLPDIGVMFPDTDDAYLGIDSTLLLKKVNSLIHAEIQSISCVIIAQKPKLATYIPIMRNKISEILNIKTSDINISATTTEHRGIIGKGDAIAASALVLLKN